MNVRYLIVTREPLVHERVISIQQPEHAPVAADLALEKQLGFARKGVAQILVEVREDLRVRRGAGDIAEAQPLAEEIVHQSGGPRVGQHPLHLARPLHMTCLCLNQVKRAQSILELVPFAGTPR